MDDVVFAGEAVSAAVKFEEDVLRDLFGAAGVAQHAQCDREDHGLVLLGPLLIRYGTEAQKQRFLPRILAGEDIWCQGYSEPGCGTDLAGVYVGDADNGVVKRIVRSA